MRSIIFYFILICINLAQSANILAIIPYPFYSHYIGFMAIFKELAQRGHNLTVVSPFPQKTPTPNLTDIVVPSILDKVNAAAPNNLEMGSLWYIMISMWEEGMLVADESLKTEPLKKLIADKDSKFDLIMTETWLQHEPFVAFGHKFNAPVVNLLSLSFFPLSAYTTGNHLTTSYAPINLYYSFNDRMNFFERVENTFVYYWLVLYGNMYYYQKQDAVMRKHFKYPGSENLPLLEDLLRNTSLTLIEHDIAVGYPVPLHKNVVEFTGVGIENPEPLPVELQRFMDENKGGVIYFSLGSFFSLSWLEPHLQETILLALNKLEHKVLMKFSDTEPRKITNKNILVKSWLPQRAILAHPNCKLFITHGGVHGTQEGFYYGVPMLALPMITDQRYNSRIITTHGVGLSLDVTSLTEKQFTDTINELLNNQGYKENAKKKSTIFKDKPIHPMDNAIYWIEYVIRHKGAPHLRPAVLDLHWYQYLMLDVIAFYSLIVFIAVYAVCKTIKLIVKCIVWTCRKQSSIKSKKE